jgi:hypothetical protein
MMINLGRKIVRIKKNQCDPEFYNKYAVMSARQRHVPLNKH